MAKYKDPEWLREKYWEEDMTMAEMGEELGENSGTICYWMQKHDIQTYNQGRNKRTPGMNMKHDPSGHVQWWNHVYENNEIKRHEVMSVHRLLAVAEYGVDAVKDKVVHHKNGIPWDNRPGNLEVMERGEHTTHHNRERIEEIKNQPRDGDGKLTPIER
jgi:hypothetical protein